MVNEGNEVRSTELAITSLISNKREWNNCPKYERKKRANPNEIEKNLMNTVIDVV